VTLRRSCAVVASLPHQTAVYASQNSELKGIDMDMDRFVSDRNIARLRQLTVAGITGTERMALFGVLNENFVNAQNLAKHRRLASAATTVAEREMQLGLLAEDERKRIALEIA
jgi:hypothetical protein